MAVTQDKVSRSSKSKYVDFDEFIEYQLKKTKAGIHHTDIISSVVVLLTVILGYILVFTICDHWVFPGGFGDLTRTILFTLMSSFTVGWLIIRIALPLYREVSVLYAAREIEETYPELKDSLLSWVQLREEGREVPADILKALEKRTAVEIKKSDIDLAVDRRMLLRWSYVLLSIVVAICVYTLFSPKNISNSVWRALVPGANIAASTKTLIVDVKPGDYEVLAHDQLDVTVDLDGVIPEEVKLFYTTADSRFVDEPSVMRNTGEGLPRFRTRLAGINGEGLLKDFTYRIEAGDAVSETYSVKINQPPSASVTEVAYDYPDYMLLDDKTQPSSTIDAWEGVWVTVRAKTNMPVVSAQLYRSDKDVAEETADVLEMDKLNGQEYEVRWRLKFREDGTFANYYFIQVENEASETDPLPTIHRIKIRPDIYPEISILSPTEDLEVPANAEVPIAFEANDPDFMLRRILLKLEREGEILPTVPRLFEGPETAQFRSRYDLDLKPLSLSPGDEVQFFLEAEDNFEPFDQLPKHVTRTSKMTLRIIEPVSEEKAEQFKEKQAEEIQNRIQEEQGQQNQRQPSMERRPQDKPEQEQPGEEESADSPTENSEEGDPQNAGDQTGKGNQSGKGQQNDSQSGPASDQQNMNDSDPGNREDTTQENTEPNGESQPEGQTEGANDSETANPGDEGANRSPGESSEQKSGDDRFQNDSSNSDQKRPHSKAQDDEALEQLLKWSQENESDTESNDEQRAPEDNPASENQNRNSPQNDSTGSDSSRPQSENQQSNQEDRANQASDTEAGESPPQGNERPGDEKNMNSASQNEGENPATPPTDQSDRENGDMTQSEGDPREPTMSEENKTETESQSNNDPQNPETNSTEQERNSTPDAQKSPSQENMNQQSGEPQSGEPQSGEPQSGEPQSGEPQSGEPQSGEPQSGEPQSGEPQSGEPQSGEPQSGEPQSGEPQSGEPQSGEPQSGEPQSGEPQSGEPQSGEPQSGEPQSGEPQSGEPQSGEPQSGEPQSGEPQSGEPQSGEPQSGEPQSGEPQSGEPQSGEPQSGEPQSGEPQSGEPQSGEPQSGEPQSGESKSGESKSGESKSGESKSGESKSGESKSGESKSGESKSGESKSGESKSGESKSGESKSGEPKSGEGAGQQPGGGAGGEGEMGESQGTGQGTQPGTQSGPGGKGGSPGSANQNGPGSEGNTVPLTQEEADLENKKKAVDLALKKLKDQLDRGKAPDELLNELGFSEQDLSMFMQRLEERLADPGINQNPDAEAARRQFNRLLKGIDYDSKGERRDGGDRTRQSAQGFGGGNRPVPPDYRIENEAFKKRLSEQGSR